MVNAAAKLEERWPRRDRSGSGRSRAHLYSTPRALGLAKAEKRARWRRRQCYQFCTRALIAFLIPCLRAVESVCTEAPEGAPAAVDPPTEARPGAAREPLMPAIPAICLAASHQLLWCWSAGAWQCPACGG
jgi:hypothetical protein